ncbi:MAG: DMT family transporter [Rhodospirillales bacterium]|jgi:drug/metabolite transporter (DMT)-like permease|nr:DMT family transporter [Rhodospirillales bacterium]MBT4625348.1 DMT family transporter [Rhodospirillales bacterium]MBT5350943.1 DMT family transporter [Rhodospirillales bacterium]MBT5520859.1 DMT family transporter [Rhodospirillales bacterium]MBT6110344.1 DMT family transporter [Rhodospirillales bacterium]
MKPPTTLTPNVLMPNPLIGVGLYLLAYTVMPFMDASAKYLSAEMSVMQVAWGRYFFHLMFLLPFVINRYGVQALKPDRFWLQLLRGAVMLVATVTFFAALSYSPMIDAQSLAYTAPLLVTILAPFFLGEKIGPVRIACVAVGFIGTLVIIRPGTQEIGPGTLFALGTGISYASYTLLTRKLAGTSPPLVTLTFTALVGSIVLTLALPFFWSGITLIQLLIMIAMGIAGAAAHYFFIKAYDYAEASFLAPLSYSSIILITVLGYFWFGDFPDVWTWTGCAIIVTAGITISVRERQQRKKKNAAGI